MASKKPVHVIELAQTLGLGGLERMVYTLAQGLNQDARFNVLIATYDEPVGQPSFAAQIQAEGIPLVQWQKKEGFSFQTVRRLVRIIFAQNVRVLHAHDLGPLVYGSLAKFFSLGRIRLVMTLHTLLHIQQNGKSRRYYKFFLRFADRIVAVAPAVKAGLIELGIAPERIDVIANGVSFSGRPNQAEKSALRKNIGANLPVEMYTTRWVLCLARIHAGKGQDVVLEVWRALEPGLRAQLALFFVGQATDAPYTEMLRQKIQGMPDRERIVIIGPSERPQDWLQSADIFISGSLLEGMPLAPLEAAGCGLPILLSAIEGHQFLKPWALYFDPAKPEEGAAKIHSILEALKRDGDVQIFETMWNAASTLRQLWDASAMTTAYAKVFNSI